jgi:hypothetical protein
MDTKSFEYLADIPTLKKQLEALDNKLNSNIEKRWLNTHEVANYTGYKLETIKSKVKNSDFIREIHYYKRDGKLLFDKFEIDKWVMGIKPTHTELDTSCMNVVDNIMKSI